MKNKLVNDINNYISYLINKGLWVTVHGKGLSGLLEHNIHNNPFCSLVKTDSAAWEKCISCQKKVFAEYKKECLFGMCYAGVEEYVFFVDNRTFVSISGYGINRRKASERIKRLSQEFYLENKELLSVYENGLKHTEENMEELKALIKPLCYMLYLLQLLLMDVSEAEQSNTVFDSIMAYVQYNFMNDISVRDIAYACSCSESTVSHLFKQNVGISIKKYITGLRMAQAKKLLETSDISINTIAQICGFSNINYFPTVFKKSTGITPTEYRSLNSNVLCK